jgi:ATP-binding cassette, subfamily C, bacterial CydCD
VLAVGWLGAPALAADTLSKPMLALLLLLPLALVDVLVPLADAGALSVRTAAADARLASLASLTPAVTSPTAPRSTDLTSPVLAADRVAAGWGTAPAFVEVSIHLPAGSRLGVVGPSGCGKSTLAAALLRFLDPMSGTVTLADVPLPELALDDVRRTVGLVDDDPHVFGSTLRENLRLARPSATDAELRRAVDAAALGGWVDALPAGLDTLLGDGAAHVSGGERARIGLARALLADQPVLVLDEPTAHLDAATATAVTRDLLATEDRTVVWITHGTIGLDRMDSVLAMTRQPTAAPA